MTKRFSLRPHWKGFVPALWCTLLLSAAQHLEAAARPTLNFKSTDNKSYPAQVETDPDNGQVQSVRGEIPMKDALSSEEAGSNFLRMNREAFGLGDDWGELRATRQIVTPRGKQIFYSHFYFGLPVWDEEALGAEGMLVMVSNRNTVASVINKTSSISSLFTNAVVTLDPGRKAMIWQAAREAVRKLTNTFELVGEPSFVQGIVAGKAEPTPVTRVQFKTKHPSTSWTVLVDPATGKAIGRPHEIGFNDGARAFIFQPNPVQSRGDTALTSASPVGLLNAARVEVQLHALDGSGRLKGTYAEVQSDLCSTNGVFDFSVSDPHFLHTMAYHWVTEGLLRLKQLGFDQVFSGPLPVVPEYSDDDNSFYDPSDHSLNFGTGGVPDAQDAEVILHELGHAIQDALDPGFGGDTHHTQVRAMGEGFGDYWAEACFASVGPSDWHVFWDKWDGQAGRGSHAAANGFPAYVRRLDTRKVYPTDWVGEEHEDGQIWSACLWSIRAALGSDRADTIILQSHTALKPGNASFQDGANAIIAENRALYAGRDETVIQGIFQDHGLLKRSPTAGQ